MATTAAPRHDAVHVCTSCGHSSPRWFGRCPSCSEWSSAALAVDAEAHSPIVADLASCEGVEARLSSRIPEVDRVLGGGVVAASVCLLAGEPGIGKSTLVLQLLQGLADGGRRCLLVTGEESLAQTRLRASRLGLPLEGLRAAEATSLETVTAASRAEQPDVLVVDSIQTLQDPRLEQAAGSVVQVRECAAALVRLAKGSGTAVILVGHVTKDGSVAGPKTLEHVVDAVLVLEGERSGSLRLLRATKNRFGSCEETGVFAMSSRGLCGVADPSAMLLADRMPSARGSVVFPGVEGSRAVLVEIQALTTSSQLPQPRRVAIGVDARRLTLLLGVMAQNDARIATRDIFVAAAGGLGVREPAADLALCLALHSASTDLAVPEDVVAVGEVGLAGEIRRVPAIERRLSEAARLGFRIALVPSRAADARSPIETIPVENLEEAVAAVARTARARRARRDGGARAGDVACLAGKDGMLPSIHG
jgi:DNA repair protein RadA/Sms